MDNKFRNISFTTENMEEFMKQYHDQANLLPLYLDKIRNGYELTEEMLHHIERFDDKSKIKIIYEFNMCYKLITENLNNT
jgi:hypothetical protein